MSHPPLVSKNIASKNQRESRWKAGTWFLARHFLRSSRWRRHIPLKRSLTLNGLHSVVTSVEHSNYQQHSQTRVQAVLDIWVECSISGSLWSVIGLLFRDLQYKILTNSYFVAPEDGTYASKPIVLDRNSSCSKNWFVERNVRNTVCLTH
jgi:hypothetical protein